MAKANEVKKEMSIEDVLAKDPTIPTLLMAQGMERVGLPLMEGRSLAEVCLDQHVDSDEAVERINEFLHNKGLFEGEEE